MMLASTVRSVSVKFCERGGPPAKIVGRLLSASVRCVYPCSTMDLVEMEEDSPVSPGIHSTWQYVVTGDFCPARSRTNADSAEDSDPAFWRNLVETKAVIRSDVHVVTQELDFIEASARRHSFDKILLLTKQCDHTVAAGAVLTEPSLTVTGAGQALSLARRVSTFCNDETRFLPELVVVAPLRRAIQTALLSFPQYSPHTVRSVPWICHPAATGACYDVRDLRHLQTDFTGLDYSPCYQQAESSMNQVGPTSASIALQRADSVLDWIRSREEKVIVVSSDASWLQAFGYAANYSEAASVFRDGELRVVGLNFV